MALSFDANPVATVFDRIRSKPEAYRPEFARWLVANWPIWQRFENEANNVWQCGRRRYSARTIGEVIRHHTALTSTDPAFKINDHVWPDLARLYMAMHPDRDGFFETRYSPNAPRLV